MMHNVGLVALSAFFRSGPVSSIYSFLGQLVELIK